MATAVIARKITPDTDDFTGTSFRESLFKDRA
jgi:hypothetical protein